MKIVLFFWETSVAINKSSVGQLIDKLFRKYIENKTPNTANVSYEKEEGTIKLDTNNINEPKKDSCTFLEFTKIYFLLKNRRSKNRRTLQFFTKAK